MKNNILFSCVSHIGNRREINQDNFICDGIYFNGNDNVPFPINGCKTDLPALFGIFDGMGGEECGEKASLIASEVAAETDLSDDPINDLVDICFRANKKIVEFAADNNINSTGTTAAMIAFSKKEIAICNVGDSKIFRYSDGILSQISEDHVGIGVYGRKPPLSQNLGIPEDEMIIEPYAARGEYVNGDIYLICSDGLTDMVPLEEITEIIDNNEFENVAERLLGTALDNGGRDNVTIILCKVKQKHFLLF